MSIVPFNNNNKLVKARKFMDPAIVSGIYLLAFLFIGTGHYRHPITFINHTGTAGTTGTGGIISTGGTTGTGGVAGSTGGSGGIGGIGGSAGSTGGAAGSTGGSAGSTGGAGGGAGCGDGVVQPGEFCDGSDLQSSTCVSLGFSGGSLSCSSSCQFNVSSCTGGTISPTITASRSSCAAPCSVFFDTTSTTGLSGTSPTPGGGSFSGDFVGANWLWDFNDPSSDHKTTKGFSVAHVFDAPGTYNVVAFVHDLAGAAGFATKTITVSAMAGTTYFVATSGNDLHAGTATTTAFATIAKALSVASTNDSILLRRGDTFSATSQTTFSQTGPFLIGAYTDPAHVSAIAPEWSISLTTAFGSAFQVSSTDMRLTDIFFNFTDTSVNPGNIFFGVNGVNTLLERVEATFNSAGGQVVNYDTGSTNFVATDCNWHDFNGYGAFMASPQFAAFIGNSITNYTTNNHAIRIQGGTNGVGSDIYATNTYIADNTITANASISGGFGDTTERGDNNKSVIVNNTFNCPSGTCLTAQPQNLSSVEHVINSLIEGNVLNDGLGSPFSLAAQHIYVRNNTIIGADTSVTVLGESQMPAGWTTNIFILNNTAYLSNGTAGGDTYFIRHQTTSGTITFGNNILWTSHNSTTSSILTTDSSGTDTNLGHNLLYAPNAGTQTNPNVGTSGLSTVDPKFVSNGTDFHLQSTSPARNAGLTTTAVYSDPSNVMRPKESVWDIGAYEYKP